MALQLNRANQKKETRLSKERYNSEKFYLNEGFIIRQQYR